MLSPDDAIFGEGGAQKFKESAGDIVLNQITSFLFFNVCIYNRYKLKYNNSTSQIPELYLQPYFALDLLMAANFLDN